MASTFQQNQQRATALMRQKAIPQLNGDPTQVARGDGTVAAPSGFIIGDTSITAGTGNAAISLSSLGISTFGTDEAGKYFLQISSGYNGSGGSFVSRYDGKNVLILNTHPSSPGRGELSLYDSSENRNVFISGGGTIQGLYTQTIPTTVAALASAAGVAGLRTCVTDAAAALSANLGGVVVGGGASFSPVYSDGSNWRQG